MAHYGTITFSILIQVFFLAQLERLLRLPFSTFGTYNFLTESYIHANFSLNTVQDIY